MKRRRDTAEDEGDDVEKKKCRTRWSKKKSIIIHTEQRSGGVVTVDETAASSPSSSSVTVAGVSAFKPMDTTPRPPPPPLTPPSPSQRPHNADCITNYLINLRKLAAEALVDNVCIARLVDHVKREFLFPSAKSSWAEECESVLTLLYVALHYPTFISPLFAQEITVEFIGRWLADTETAEITSLVLLFTDDVRFADFSVLVLLLGNHCPEEVEESCLKECLAWNTEWSPGLGPPDWLLNAQGCVRSVVALKNLLFASCMMLKGLPWVVDTSKDYAGVFVDFLYACKLYKEQKYKDAVTDLQKINMEKCSNSLQSWILWLTGLVLYKIGKPNMALIKLQAAVENCDGCVPAVFNMWQIFNKLGIEAAEVETLSLLTSSEDWQPHGTMNLQSSLLRLHHPPPADLVCLSHFLLASRCLSLKMYEESCSNVTLLLQKLTNEDNNVTTRHTLFRLEDEIPRLPKYENISVLQALAYFQNEDYESAVTVLEDLKEEDTECFDYYIENSDKKMMVITAATASLIKYEATAKLGNTDDGICGCSRLEQHLSWVRGPPSSEWEECIFILKTVVFFTLSFLHELKGNKHSCSHYKRLATQNRRLLLQSRSVPVWTGLSFSDKLIMDNIYMIINDRLSTIQ